MTKRLYVSIFAVAAVAFASVSWAQPAGSPVARHGALSVKGNKIVGQHGNPVALRGMSFFWNTPGWGGESFYTAGALNTLADDWKVDIVRVAVDPEQTNQNNWKTIVTAAKAKGIYVIIDFHAHSKDLSGSAKTFFEGLAKDANYKNVPNILYEIFNEPCGSTANQNGGGGCKGDNWNTDIKPYAETVVGAIRAQGDTSVVIIGTPMLSKRVDEAAANPVTAGNGKNLAYAVHFYTGHVVTASDPTGEGSEHRNRLRTWVAAGLNKGVAVFASEFGVSQPGGGAGQGENNSIDTAEALVWFNFLDENQIGWANWSVNNKNEACSALGGGANNEGSNWSSNLSAGGRFIRNRLIYYATPVTLTTSATGEGDVAASPAGPYYPWQQVAVTATAKSGNRFEGWASGVTENLAKSPASITMKGNTKVEAVFFPNNLISNSTFTANMDGWGKQPTSGSGTVPDATVTNGELVITMPTNRGDEPFAVRVQHTNTSLTQGRKYKLTFDARATAARTIQAAYRTASNTPSGHKLNIGAPVSLTTTKAAYEREFDMLDVATTTGVIAFYLGGQAGNVTIDNVKLEDAGPASGQPPGPCETGGATAECCAVNPTFPGCSPDPCAGGQPTTACCAVNSAFPGCPGTGVKFPAVKARSTVWSIARVGGALQLRGPAEVGATVSLYDVRGKMVRNMAARDGMSLGAGIPAGSYIVIVKNRAGSEVLRTKAVVAR